MGKIFFAIDRCSHFQSLWKREDSAMRGISSTASTSKVAIITIFPWLLLSIAADAGIPIHPAGVGAKVVVVPFSVVASFSLLPLPQILGFRFTLQELVQKCPPPHFHRRKLLRPNSNDDPLLAHCCSGAVSGIASSMVLDGWELSDRVIDDKQSSCT